MTKKMLSILILVLCPALVFSQTIMSGPAIAEGPAIMTYGTAPVEPTFTWIQGEEGTGESSGSTLSVTLSSAPAAGDAVVCAVIGYPTSLTISSIVDNASTPNSYTVTPNSPSSAQGSSARVIWLAYLLNVPSGAGTTITTTFSGTITYGSVMGCDEFHRSSGTWAFDNDIAGSGTTTPFDTPSVTPTNAGELIYFGVTCDSSESISSVNSPWTESEGLDGTGNYQIAGYVLSAASGATAINVTAAGNASYDAMGMALK